MGCDIHVFVEYRYKSNKGVWSCFHGGLNLPRSYAMFGRLADGVKGYSGMPIKGWPENLSYECETAKIDADYFSHSWATRKEWKNAIKTINEGITHSDDFYSVDIQWSIVSTILKKLEKEGYETRVLYTFDN